MFGVGAKILMENWDGTVLGNRQTIYQDWWNFLGMNQFKSWKFIVEPISLLLSAPMEKYLHGAKDRWFLPIHNFKNRVHSWINLDSGDLYWKIRNSGPEFNIYRGSTAHALEWHNKPVHSDKCTPKKSVAPSRVTPYKKPLWLVKIARFWKSRGYKVSGK